VVLKGCLPTYYLKQVAQEAVDHLEGVVPIDNQIEVLSPVSQPRADADKQPLENLNPLP
jgi:osmotically-inducible protein OsmY